jgi:Fe2+ transport system protein FeoA
MNLAQASIGQVVTVEHVGGERSFRRRLMELGILPNTQVEMKGVAPLGDPLELLVRGCSLSIRRAEAAEVVVRESRSSLQATPRQAPSKLPPRSAIAGALGLMRIYVRGAR